jgi:hypothetical protein
MSEFLLHGSNLGGNNQTDEREPRGERERVKEVNNVPLVVPLVPLLSPSCPLGAYDGSCLSIRGSSTLDLGRRRLSGGNG